MGQQWEQGRGREWGVGPIPYRGRVWGVGCERVGVGMGLGAGMGYKGGKG